VKITGGGSSRENPPRLITVMRKATKCEEAHFTCAPTKNILKTTIRDLDLEKSGSFV
jgi:hypothetical protein